MSKIFLSLFTLSILLFASEVEVTLIKPKQNTLPVGIDVEGVVIARNKIALTAKANGILKLFIENNRYVKLGDKIAKIVDERRTKKLYLLKRKVQLLKSQVTAQKLKLKDAKEIYIMGVGSKNSYLSEEVTLKQLQELYETIKSEYEILLLEENNSLIFADDSGYINNLLPQNSYVNYGNSIATIFTKDRSVKLFVDPKYATHLTKGRVVKLRSSYKNCDGTIVNISSQSSDNLVEVIVQPKESLPINLQIDATIILKRVKGLSIAKSAVVLVENHPAVYIIKDGIAHLKYIEIIKDMIDTVLIKDNLPKESQIALKNAYMLHDGLEVSAR